MTDTSTTQALEELARRAEITCKARYHAARRLNSHNWFSQWTLALLAVGQITLSVAQAIRLPLHISENWFNLGSIFFGVLILAYSLLLGMSNFAARAVRIHECGLELGRLARKLYQAQRAPAVRLSEYNDLSSRYYNILEKHENHTRTDYLVAHYEYYQARGYGTTTESRTRFKLFVARAETHVFQILQFCHYVISLVLMVVFSYISLIAVG